ncbi:GD14209 [Drosophila simulans]|uniref:GD14209 n=1 Tax=Drosophila simulans TaxID=7240 RepID=B4QNM8_DROSI|nr:GD14209 [Drosophila simulans]
MRRQPLPPCTCNTSIPTCSKRRRCWAEKAAQAAAAAAAVQSSNGSNKHGRFGGDYG